MTAVLGEVLVWASQITEFFCSWSYLFSNSELLDRKHTNDNSIVYNLHCLWLSLSLNFVLGVDSSFFHQLSFHFLLCFELLIFWKLAKSVKCVCQIDFDLDLNLIKQSFIYSVIEFFSQISCSMRWQIDLILN